MKKGRLYNFYQKIKMSHGKITAKKALSLISVFFKIGLFTFGGGYAMLPLIQREIVEKKKWLTDIEIMEVLVGALLSTLFLVIPSFVIIFVISLFFEKFISIEWIKNAFIGIQAAVAVLIISAAEKLFKKMPKTAMACILFVITTVFMFALKLLNIDFSSINIILLGFGISIGLCGISMQKEVVEESSNELKRTLK